VAGAEYLHDNIAVSEPQNKLPFLNLTRDLNRYGTYLNGAFSFRSLTLLPGIRLDQIGSQQVASYNIGSTLLFSDKTLLRIYAAKGYSLPIINFQNGMQNIWTVQAGIESSAIPMLWAKGTFFYSETSNIESYFVPGDYPATSPSIIKSEQKKHGLELELRTVPFYGFSLATGFTYSHIRSNKSVRTSYIPDSTTKITLYYNNEVKGFRATVTGSHVNWPSDTGNSVHDKQIIWNLHLSQKLPSHAGLFTEIFFSGHNLLNNAQYIDDYRMNAPSWFEGGIRFKF
jgi:vitamin B12 transporter